MGSVGPSQFIVAINGRFRSYDKTTGTADGVLDSDPDVFFASVMTPPVASNFTSDPHIRYDRLSQRWFIVIIDVPGGAAALENRVLLAVSDGPTITNSTVWTFFFWAEDAGGPNESRFADYPTLGIDANALYIGMNMFNLSGSYAKSNLYVVRKTSVLGAGPVVVSRFAATDAFFNGAFAPQGVDNFDPAATTGYFIGVDAAFFDKLAIATVTDPGGTPVVSKSSLAVAATSFPLDVTHLGGSGSELDALDDRLFAAQMRNGHIWTAHNIGTTSTGAASSSPTRTSTRWYEVNTAGGPSLVQSGTIFDSTATNPKSYWIPTLAVSGQNIMALGGSVAGAVHRPDAWFSGRLPSDAAGTTDTPTEYTSTTANYNPGDGLTHRWGDYSITMVDPDDDMTMWTIQEYVAGTDLWGTRVARLRAPAPATPSSSSPAAVPFGHPAINVTITGTSGGGTGFFDPGAAFPKHISATATCGITVNAATYLTATTVRLNLDTMAASGGPCDVTVTNPDGQAATGAGIFSLTSGNSLPTLDPIGDKSVDSSHLLSFTLSANDADDDSLTYSASNLPSGATFDVPTKTFNWTPTPADTGAHPNVHFEVTDGITTDSEDITITVVDHAPTLGAIGDKTVGADHTLAFVLTGSDPDGDPLTFSATSLPPGASFNAGTKTFTWTPPASAAGGHPGVHFEVTDGLLKDSEEITITVTTGGTSTTTIDATVVATSLDISGEVSPNHTGRTVTVTLFRLARRANGRRYWRRIGVRTPTLDAASTYEALFPALARGRCKARTVFAGDASHSGSSAVMIFTCAAP